MSWNTLRTWEVATPDEDWVGDGTVPETSICGNVGGRSTVLFDAVWLDGEDGAIVAGAGEVTLQPILVVDAAPERATAAQAEVAAVAREPLVVSDLVGRFTLRCSAATPPGGATHLRISWAYR
jgi:hypothetical protein